MNPTINLLTQCRVANLPVEIVERKGLGRH
jgi:hypothetical protein